MASWTYEPESKRSRTAQEVSALKLSELQKWKIFYFLSEEQETILSKTKIVHVLVDNEAQDRALIVTTEDEVFIVTYTESLESSTNPFCKSNEHLKFIKVQELCGQMTKEIVMKGVHNFVCTEDGQVYHFCLKKDGSVEIWDSTLLSLPSRFLSKIDPRIVQIAVSSKGPYHVLALTDKGQVICWGRNLYGENASPFILWQNNPSAIPSRLFNDESITEIGCLSKASFAITESHKLYYWGRFFGILQEIPHQLTEDSVKAIKVVCGVNYIAFLTNDGKIYYCGREDPWKNMFPLELNGFALDLEVDSASDFFACVTQEQRIYLWGDEEGVPRFPRRSTFGTMREAFAAFNKGTPDSIRAPIVPFLRPQFIFDAEWTRRE